MSFKVMKLSEIGDDVLTSFKVCDLAGFSDREIDSRTGILYDSASKNVTHMISEGALETGIVHPGGFGFQSEERPWMVATPDRLVTNPLADMEMPSGLSPPAALSLMVTSGRVKGPIAFYWSAGAANVHPLEAPVAHATPVIRVHHEMDVLELEHAYIAAFNPETGDVRLGEFERYEPLIDLLREIGRREFAPEIKSISGVPITRKRMLGLVREAINETYKEELN